MSPTSPLSDRVQSTPPSPRSLGGGVYPSPFPALEYPSRSKVFKVANVVFVCFSDFGSVKRPLEGLLVAWGVSGRIFGAFGSSWAGLGVS